MKKGFTLIELLAVIVILAIIALIATPIILGIINDAKDDSEKRSIENYVHAVELAIARDATKKGGVIEPGTYEIVPEFKGKKIKSESGNIIEVDYKGEAITDGTIIVLSEEGKEGQIELSGISFDGGKTKYSYSEKSGVTKDEGENNASSSQFKVSSNGILMHYEREGNETSVVVPKEVNGIKITGILQHAFMDGDAIYYEEEQLMIGLTEKARELKSIAEQNNLNFAMIDEFGHGNDPINISAILNKNSSGYAEAIEKIEIIDTTNLDNLYINIEENLSNYYLENIDLSNMEYLEVIGDFAFMGYEDWGDSSTCRDYYTCVKVGPLKSVKLPTTGNLKTIGEHAFMDNQLTELIIPSSLQTIGDSAFSYNKLKSVTINEGLTTLEREIFEWNLLEEVVIPSSVTSVEYSAFSYNQNLKKIIIKRANREGISFAAPWHDGYAEVIYDPN